MYTTKYRTEWVKRLIYNIYLFIIFINICFKKKNKNKKKYTVKIVQESPLTPIRVYLSIYATISVHNKNIYIVIDDLIIQNTIFPFRTRAENYT